MTTAPSALPICTAPEPVPPAPACTSSVSPGLQSSPLVQREPTEVERVVQRGAVDAAHRRRGSRAPWRRRSPRTTRTRRGPSPGCRRPGARPGARRPVPRSRPRRRTPCPGTNGGSSGKRRVAAADDVDVVEVQAERLDGDAHLVGLRAAGPRRSGARAPAVGSPSDGGDPRVGLDRSAVRVSIAPRAYGMQLRRLPGFGLNGCVLETVPLGGSSCPPSPSTTRSCSPVSTEPAPDARARARSRASSRPITRSKAPASRCGVRSRAASTATSPTRSSCSTSSARSTTRPNEAVGAPWHPHRGFETVTYVIDGVVEHHDSNGGGGVIGEGDTQWMTAGSGILHDEVPTETFRRNGGRTHGVQLWVNLPAALKMSPPRYQAITGDELTLASSSDGGALVRLIAGDLGGSVRSRARRTRRSPTRT